MREPRTDPARTHEQVLQSLNRKGIVDRKSLKGMIETLAEREAAHKAADESSDATVSGDEEEEPRRKRRRFSDSIIQQRMEEDRERVMNPSPPNSVYIANIFPA
jgi:hypothetical protein